MMVLNHLVVVIFGGMEVYYADKAWFYNVFCTLLFVTDPILIFIPTVILQHLFAVQAKRKQRTEKSNAVEALAVLGTERDVDSLDRSKMLSN
jgi:hypothetical protein